MIDTIEFVLHDVNKKVFDLQSYSGQSFKNDFNQIIYDRLLDYESVYLERNKQFKKWSIVENPDGREFKRYQIGKDYVSTVRDGAVFSSEKGTDIYYHKVNGKIEAPSSDYRVIFSINENMDAITFSLSIPKYFYGTNIAQFVPQVNSKRYQEKLFSMRTFRTQTEILHQRIIEFLYTFFDDLSVLLNLPSIANFNLENVEIKRLDLCYNQFFPSNEMVIDYIRAQKKFYEAKIKKNTLVGNETDTSLYYRHSTDGFYFKIYSKGHEFINNDLPRLLKENEVKFDRDITDKKTLEKFKEIFKKHFPETEKKLKGKIEDLIFAYYKTYINSNENQGYVYDIEKLLKIKCKFLLESAKKILRYEMSFTRTYMSTLYKRELFRKYCKNWKTLKSNYDKVKRYDLYLSQGQKAKADAFKKKHMIDYGAIVRYFDSKEEIRMREKSFGSMRKDYDIVHKSLNKKHEFRIKSTNKVKAHEQILTDDEFRLHRIEKRYQIEEIKEATLTPELLKIMYTIFESEIEFFQVKEVEETTTILDQIDKYNEKAKRKTEAYIQQFGEASYKKLTHTQKRKQNLSQLNKTRLKIVVDFINQGKSLNQIFNQLAITKSQKYTLLDDLKKFNIHKQTVTRSFSTFKPKTDFSTYYENFYLNDWGQKLFVNPHLSSFDTIRSVHH